MSAPFSPAAEDDAPPRGAGAEGTAFRWPDELPPGAREVALVPARSRGDTLRWLLAAAGVVAGAAVWLAPTPDGLSAAGQAACAVFLVCTTLWISEVIPIGATGLLAVALLGISGAMKQADAYAAFGNSAVFFIIGVFILAAGLIHSGLSRRLALLFVRRFQRGARTLAVGIMVTAAFMTVWMPAQATAAMLFPITLEIARAMELKRGSSPYGKVLFLSLAWGAMVGSNASFLGSTRAPLALGLLARSYGETISFATWALAAAPVVILGLGIGILVLRAWFPAEPVDMHAARRAIDDSVAQLGRAGRPQLLTGAVVGVTLVAWVVSGGRVDLAAIALLSAASLFALRLLKWSDLEGYVHWGIVLMYGGAIALGQAVESTGAARWIVGGITGGAQIPVWMVVSGLIVLTVVLTEFMSNAAAVAVTLPLGFTIAEPLGLSPAAVVLTCSLAAGLDFTFPFSSAPSTIAYSGGYIGMRDMLGAGSLMTLLQVLLLTAVAFLWWPVLGIL